MIFPAIIFSQPSKVKKAKSQQLAIDILYNKYKNQDSTTIYFPGGSLKGKIEISYNDENKPSSITIQGNTWIVDNITKFVSSFVLQKLAKGFKDDNGAYGENSSQDYLKYELDHGNEFKITLTKGNEYTTIYCYKSAPKNSYAPQGSYEELENKLEAKYNFSISTADLGREAGSTGKKFNF